MILKDLGKYKENNLLILLSFEELQKSKEILFYQTDDGKVKIDVLFECENFWLTQKAIAELFNINIPAISKHLKNIYDAEELNKESTISKKEIVQKEGSREIKRMVDYFNLDAIIAVGYKKAIKNN